MYMINKANIMNYAFKNEDPYVFVSYSHEDKIDVVKDIEKLAERGVNIWYDTNIKIGDNWERYAKPMLEGENCMAVLYYASLASLVSTPCYDELHCAKIIFDNYTRATLLKLRDIKLIEETERNSKKIIPIVLFDGQVSQLFDKLLQTAKTSTAIQGSEIEWIRQYIFHGNKVLYGKHKKEGSHISEIVDALKELPKSVFTTPANMRQSVSKHDDKPIKSKDENKKTGGGKIYYRLIGRNQEEISPKLSKGDLVNILIADYINTNAGVTTDDICAEFPFGKGNRRIVEEEWVINKITVNNPYAIKKYLSLSKGTRVATLLGWDVYTDKFIEKAEKIGYRIIQL